MIKKAIGLILLSVMGMQAQAAEDSANYYGLTLMQINASVPTSIAPTGVMLRLGHRFSYDFAMEFHTGTTQSNTSPSIDRSNSIFLRWSAPYERFQLYTLIGMSRISYTTEGTQSSLDSTSYGAGAIFETKGPYHIMLEWVNYVSSSSASTNSVNLGFVRYF
ncbi:MAG: hypothetical protein OEX12_07805 [Gammaproteobacteria bacterium]|nr:hypothetical protein [Gammaproteobacteria bacterium]